MRFEPYPYQTAAVNWILSRQNCALFLGMGMGKTVCTLTAIDVLMYERFDVRRVLVIAPKRVAETTWTSEAGKWDHLRHLRVSRVIGSEAQRKRALSAEADIYAINRENVPWLCEYLANAWDFDMVVIDELSSFKSHSSMRFKALRKMLSRITRVVGLTGTPAPNGLIDLWAQIYLLDRGERLFKTVGAYRSAYFLPERMSGYIIYSYKLRQGAAEEIHAKISDLCMSLRKEDYLTLPGQIYETVAVEPTQDVAVRYKKFVRDAVLAIADTEGITAMNAAILTGKLLQFSNGAVYDDRGEAHTVHDLKLDALEDLLEAASGESVLVFYQYKHDRERILRRFPDARVLDTAQDIDDWNAGRLPVAISHPASVGHGLNLQEGGHIIIWFGLPWSLELYQQANERLNRPGQQEVCRIYHLILAGTYEERVLAALSKKDTSQQALIDALKQEVGL